MSKSYQTYDHIEAYLKGKLSDVEKAAFEDAMLNDADLKLEVDIQRTSREVLQHSCAQDLSQLINECGKSYTSPKNNKWWVLGGLGIGVLIFCYWLFNDFSTYEKFNEDIVHPRNDKNASSPTVVVIPEGDEIRDKGYNGGGEKKLNTITIEDDVDKPLDENKEIDRGVEVVQKSQDSSFVSIKDYEEVVSTEKNEVIGTVMRDSCDEMPEISYTIDPAHQGLKDGVVTISNKTDMYLQYALIPLQENYTGNRIIEGVASGMYQLKVKSEECEYEIAILDVPITLCDKKKDFTFNIAYETSFDFILPKETTGRLLVVDKSGVEVMDRMFDKNETIIWDGMNKNGNQAAEGIHKVIVKTAQETCVYNVVVAK